MIRAFGSYHIYILRCCRVRRNLDPAKNLLEALIKREEKKRNVMESKVCLQMIQLKYKNRVRFQTHGLMDSRMVMPSGGGVKREFRCLLDPLEPVLLFTKPLVPEKLAAAGIIPPIDSSIQSSRVYNIRGRIGRGGE